MKEAEWCCFINRQLDVALEMHVKWPRFNDSFLSQHQIAVLKRKYLKKSYFVEATAEQSHEFGELLPEGHAPSWTSRYGPGGLLLGWLHPGYTKACAPIGQVLRPQRNMTEVELLEEPPDASFRATIEAVGMLATEWGLRPVPWDDAVTISELEGESLVPINQYQEFDTANMAHYFHEMPSPVFLCERHVQFVQVWAIAAESHGLSPQANFIQVPSLPGDELFSVALLSRIQRGGGTGRLYASTCIDMTIPSQWPARQAVDAFVEGQLSAYMAAVRDEILRRWPEATLETIKFWRDEVGFIIDETRYAGNPWTEVSEIDILTGRARRVRKRTETLEEFEAVLSKYQPTKESGLNGDGNARGGPILDLVYNLDLDGGSPSERDSGSKRRRRGRR